MKPCKRGHRPAPSHHHNQGLDFGFCDECGCDLIRGEAGEWIDVPKGYRVVWRSEAPERVAPPFRAPWRHAPRNALPQPPRDRRGPPLFGTGGLIGTLAHLAELIRDEEQPEDGAEPSGPAIRLPG